MALHYTTHCDGCGLVIHDWPEGNLHDGWVMVQTDAGIGERRDYCPECWKVMQETLAERVSKPR